MLFTIARSMRSAVAFATVSAFAMPAFAEGVGAMGHWQGGKARPAAAATAGDTAYGIFYDRYEPTFYTGFAPRVRDPERIHVHIGRGNQVRVTVVLSDTLLESYVRDLHARFDTVRTLVESGEIKLTQNANFEPWRETHQALGLARLVAAEAELSPESLRERNLALLERLNPGRVFRIRMPVDALIRRWSEQVTAADPGRMTAERQVELLNAMLPTRLWLDREDVTPAIAGDLGALVVEAVRLGAEPRAEEVAALRAPFLSLLERVSGGLYPVRGDVLEFAEFTAIYPVGSVNQYTTHKGRQIPLYPTPGRRDLMVHQRTRTIDHIPTVAVYSYSPWIPYMHVGSNMHNSFHTLWWKMTPKEASFLPAELRETGRLSREGKPYRYLWLLSRGPMSHGCTHVNAGHISELRQLLPAEPKDLDHVEVFINKSHLFDVFDIDGDLEPEVMGVKYFVAYSLANKRPDAMRAPTDREGFYEWLYGGELRYDEDGRGYFEDVRDGGFKGDRAVDGDRYQRVRLYEAEYEPERIQFYDTKPIPFVRELRKVGADHPFSAERANTDRDL